MQVDEFPAITPQDMVLAMETLKDSKTTLMFHAEMEPCANGNGNANGHSHSNGTNGTNGTAAPDVTSYKTFLDSRPPTFETGAVQEILAAAHIAPSLHLHIVHLSATQCIPMLKEARAKGVNITAETCFHYLGLSAEEIEKGDTRHKCCPPIREGKNRDRLWEELMAEDSCITTVVSDHSPCTPELKLLPEALQVSPPAPEQIGTKKNPAGDFMAAWGGISSVGLGLPIIHSKSLERSKTSKTPTITDIVRLCAQATAEQVGLAHRKGSLRAGMDADICIFDDAEMWTFSQGDMRWKNRCSPWEGHEFTGRVKETWLRGRKIYEHGGSNGGFVDSKPFGESIVEKRTV